MEKKTLSNYYWLITLLLCLIAFFTQGCFDQTPIYQPGTYFNESEGYYSTLLVQVTVNAYNIEDIVILEHEEPEILADVVFKKLPPKSLKRMQLTLMLYLVQPIQAKLF